MIVLTTTSDIIRLVTSAAVALDVNASYADNTTSSYTPGKQNTAISTATTTTVVSAPAASTQRGVKRLSAHARGGANTVTAEFFDGTTAFRLLSVALGAGETLEYEDAHGWRVLSALGEIKTTFSGSTPPPTQSHVGWAPTAAAQNSNLLTLQPAGHAPGLYLVGISQLVRTVAASSQGVETITWSNGGAQSLLTGAGNNGPLWSALGVALNGGTGAKFQFHRVIYSDGTSAITVQVQSAGTMATTPVIDVHASAMRVGS